MRQLTVTGERRLEWLEVPAPRLAGPEGAIVRPLAVAVCDVDRAIVTGRFPALPYPIAIGHEIVAEVMEVGDAVRDIRPGMRVVLPLHVSCGACPSCGSRRTNSCEARPPFSNYGLGAKAGDWGGGMSDLLSVPWADGMAVPVPEGLSVVDCAAVGCNLVDMHRTIAPHLADHDGPSVLIVGGDAHNMALYGVLMARALGVTRVDFMDDDPARLAAAERLGARPVALDARDFHPIVVDCSGDPARLSIALSRTAADGVCTPVWPYPGELTVPYGAMFRRNVTLVTGQPHARANIEPVLGLMARGRLSSTAIPVEVLPWEDAPRAYGFGEIKRIFVRE